MLAIFLTWGARNLIEVAITGVLVTLLMAAIAAIPFLAERYIDDKRDEVQ